MYQFDAGQDRLCPSKRFESLHQAYPTFDIPVILFNQVIQILVLPDSNGFFFWFVGVECSQRCRVGTTFLNGRYLRLALVSNSLAKEAQRAAAASRLAVSRKSMVWPEVSTAR